MGRVPVKWYEVCLEYPSHSKAVTAQSCKMRQYQGKRSMANLCDSFEDKLFIDLRKTDTNAVVR